jgi:hypothetical protein
MAEPEFSAAPRPRSGVAHVRYRHTERFTVVGNHLTQHHGLSLTAVGLAVYIQSLPDGASVGIKELTKRWPESELRIARALRELEDAGYLVRERVRTPNGQVVTRTTFYEHPAARCRAVTRPESRPLPAPEPVETPEPEPTSPDSPLRETALTALRSLRRRDPRLLLSARDIDCRAPDACAWLERGVRPADLVHALTSLLPAGEIRSPARLLAFRLADGLPAGLPEPPISMSVAPPTKSRPARPAPIRTCDGCDRAIRAHDPTARCRDCRRTVLRGTSEPEHHRYAELARSSNSAATGSHRRETAC